MRPLAQAPPSWLRTSWSWVQGPDSVPPPQRGAVAPLSALSPSKLSLLCFSCPAPGSQDRNSPCLKPWASLSCHICLPLARGERQKPRVTDLIPLTLPARMWGLALESEEVRPQLCLQGGLKNISGREGWDLRLRQGSLLLTKEEMLQ